MGASGGVPADPPAEWVETEKDGVWLGKVRDFAGHEAAAFALRESGKVLYLDLRREKPSGRDEFIPAPRASPFKVSAPPRTAGKVRYFAIRDSSRRSAFEYGRGRRGTYLGYEPAASAEPSRLGLDALAVLAAGGDAAAGRDYRAALPLASPADCYDAVRALLWTRSRNLLKESLRARPSMLGEDAHEEWKARFFAEGIEGLTKLQAPEGRGDLAVLARAAREWTPGATPLAAARALDASLGTEFWGRAFAPPRQRSPGLESRIEPRYGPFEIETVEWWNLCFEIEPRFARCVLAELGDKIGETGIWIKSADARLRQIVACGQPAWILAEQVNVPEGAGFGSRVSAISRVGRDGGKLILALKLESSDPEALASVILKTAGSRDIGMLARERAAGRPGLPSDWPKRVDSLGDFSPLEALQISRDPEFLEDLEALLPRTLKEARVRHDTSSIQPPIVVALGWMASTSYDRARRLLDQTPELIRAHGRLTPYQQSLIVHARRLADRLEKPEAPLPEVQGYADSDIHAWMRSLGLTYAK